ncbi:MAG: rhomboid family intramembrane serine protease [Oscillospiraceae bacterium]|nr:rhomboid family intramembrane serine protease [Oscillospiraceae bacterium]
MNKPKFKITYNSPVILTFMLVSFAVLVLSWITGGKSDLLLFSVYRSSLLDPLFYIRLFTHILGHSGLEHFVGNFMIILLIGPMLEEKYGKSRMIIMILLTAFVTGLINVVFFPGSALLGASGIAFMLILLSGFASSKSGELPLTLIFVAALYIGQEIMAGIFAADNISQLTHIIGGVCGFGFGLATNNKKF